MLFGQIGGLTHSCSQCKNTPYKALRQHGEQSAICCTLTLRTTLIIVKKTGEYQGYTANYLHFLFL
ncbi:hypothetical protein, partial [Photobacterium carnosum]|uniref:hypothetical protein n=1 Tax=Photobacterium carnosum TaxID=2023717 RepID=UPI001E401674